MQFHRCLCNSIGYMDIRVFWHVESIFRLRFSIWVISKMAPKMAAENSRLSDFLVWINIDEDYVNPATTQSELFLVWHKYKARRARTDGENK